MAVARQSDEGWPFRALAVLALVTLALVGWMHQAERTPQIRPRTMRLACTVIAVEAADSGSTAYTCETDAGPAISINGPGGAPSVGEHVLARGRVEPFDAPRNPGEPDLRSIEHERGIEAHMSGAHILARLPPARVTLQIRIALLHAWALAQLRAKLAEPYASIVAGELWGERGSLPPELRAEFQETGTVHVLVTAGLHLGVVAMVVLWLLRACTAPRAASCIVAIAVLWTYALFSGLHLPSVRAAVMISFGLIAFAIGAAPNSWRGYACALFAIALFRPETLVGASFALSFSCVGAILLLADPIAKALEPFALPERLKEALTLTIATQAGTWPLTAAIFLLFSPYAAVANLLVVPVVGLTMILAGAQLLFAWHPTLAQLIANVNGWLLAWIAGAVHAIAGLPGAAIAMTPPPVWAIACYDTILVLAAWLWKREARTPALTCLCVAIALVVTPPVFPDRRLRITVLDVGQADGIVIQTPDGHTILVDAGGRLERGSGATSSAEQVGQRIVVPFLRRAGVRRIDALILSHPHGDHVGAAAPILRDGFSVGELADSGQQYGGYAYRDAVAMARADRVSIVYPRAGIVWRTNDGVTLTFIGPSLPFIESDNTINDNSIAFILQYKRFRMLFTGDAGVSAEKRFLNNGADLHATVLKVGHHGSAYSSSPAFISAVRPEYAIISVGRHNLFGHPAPSTIETLKRFGITVYRTDNSGAATVVTDGRSVGISTML